MNKIISAFLILAIVGNYSCASSKRKNSPKSDNPSDISVSDQTAPPKQGNSGNTQLENNGQVVEISASKKEKDVNYKSKEDNSKYQPPIPVIYTNEWVTPFYYNTMQYKAKCSYASENGVQNFTANVKVKKDSQMLISIVGLGVVEVARALIRPDSIFVLDRINSKAYVKDYSYLDELTGVTLDYYTFQNLLTNEVPQELTGTEIDEDSTVTIVYPANQNIEAEININKYEHLWKYMNLVFNSGKVDSVKVDFMDYISNSGVAISMHRLVQLYSDASQPSLDMTLEKVTIDPEVDFYFSIPDRYEVIR